jgi:hypothetical protein
LARLAFDHRNRVVMPRLQLKIDALHHLGTKLLSHEVVKGQAPAVAGFGLDPGIIDLDADDRMIILHANNQRAAA